MIEIKRVGLLLIAILFCTSCTRKFDDEVEKLDTFIKDENLSNINYKIEYYYNINDKEKKYYISRNNDIYDLDLNQIKYHFLISDIDTDTRITNLLKDEGINFSYRLDELVSNAYNEINGFLKRCEEKDNVTCEKKSDSLLTRTTTDKSISHINYYLKNGRLTKIENKLEISSHTITSELKITYEK